jgi:uncharacterized protein with PQ loop repeat
MCMIILDVMPLVATVAAVPQLLPQLLRLIRSRRPDGVSPTWASLTAASNLGWLAYFTSTGLWTAMVPSATCGLLAGAIVVALAGAGARVRWGATVGAAWLAVLAGAFLLAGPSGLGAVLTVAFLLQVTPSLRSAWRTASPVGVSRVTWGLICIEVVCWGTVGVFDARPPLIVLGATGSVATAAMLWLTRSNRGTTARPILSGAT